MNWTVVTYLGYLAITVPLTIWVAATLSRNGRVFLADVFAGDEALADAVNRLLVVGFYLLNLGFVTLYLRVDDTVADLTAVVETLSVKVGIVMLVLGVIHFLNIWFFNAIRRRSRLDALRTAPLPMPSHVPPATPPYPAARR